MFILSFLSIYNANVLFVNDNFLRRTSKISVAEFNYPKGALSELWFRWRMCLEKIDKL